MKIASQREEASAGGGSRGTKRGFFLPSFLPSLFSLTSLLIFAFNQENLALRVFTHEKVLKCCLFIVIK